MYQAARKLLFTDCRCADDASKVYEDLFRKLDTNADGKVDVTELKAGLAALGIKTGKGAAQVRADGPKRAAQCDNDSAGTPRNHHSQAQATESVHAKRCTLLYCVLHFRSASPKIFVLWLFIRSFFSLL